MDLTTTIVFYQSLKIKVFTPKGVIKMPQKKKELVIWFKRSMLFENDVNIIALKSISSNEDASLGYRYLDYYEQLMVLTERDRWRLPKDGTDVNYNKLSKVLGTTIKDVISFIKNLKEIGLLEDNELIEASNFFGDRKYHEAKTICYNKETRALMTSDYSSVIMPPRKKGLDYSYKTLYKMESNDWPKAVSWAESLMLNGNYPDIEEYNKSMH